MNTWLAIAGIGVATDNLLLASVAGGFGQSHLLKKWLSVLGVTVVIQLQGLILGWLVGNIMDKWLGAMAHWLGIVLILCLGVRILFEVAASKHDHHARSPIAFQSIVDGALGTAMYTFIYGQSANMLHATFPLSLELVSVAAVVCVVGGLTLYRRDWAIWFGRLVGRLIICSSAVFLLLQAI